MEEDGRTAEGDDDGLGRGVDAAVTAGGPALPIVVAGARIRGAGARAASAGAAGAGAAAGRTKWWFVVVALTWKVTTNSA